MSEREYAEYVRDIIKRNMDSVNVVRKDFIVLDVGTYGFHALIKYGLIESRGFMNDCEIFTLRRK